MAYIKDGQFGFVTVMDVTVNYAWDSDLEEYTKELEIDSLRISNITQEGPRKESRGGMNAKPLVRYGKTMRLEMEDVIMKAKSFEAFMGAELVMDSGVPTDLERILVKEVFSKPCKIEGTTYVIDKDTGEREYVDITIFKFLPDSIFELTMESEGDVGVMNIAGEIFPNECGVFYVLGDGDDPCAE